MSDDAEPPLSPVAPKIAKAPFADAVFVCSKCAKKFKGAGRPVFSWVGICGSFYD